MSSKIHATSHVHIYPSKPAIGLAAAQHVADISAAAIQARGRVLVAISGGSLPKILTSGMLDGNVAQTIDFDKWHVFFADERIVPLDHDDSNFKACNDVMFSQVSASETFVQQIYSIGNGNEGKDPAQVAADYQVKVQEQLKLSNGAFDLVLLGMGPDGHTASLFPNHELLHENELLVASINDSPKLPPKRITLTYPVLNGARNVLFVAAGGSKAENLPKVIPPGSTMSNNGGAVVSINGGAAADTELLPAARVRPSAGSLHFYVDEDAASLLAPTTSDL